MLIPFQLRASREARATEPVGSTARLKERSPNGRIKRFVVGAC
jgi:hypothetical protein